MKNQCMTGLFSEYEEKHCRKPKTYMVAKETILKYQGIEKINFIIVSNYVRY